MSNSVYEGSNSLLPKSINFSQGLKLPYGDANQKFKDFSYLLKSQTLGFVPNLVSTDVYNQIVDVVNTKSSTETVMTNDRSVRNFDAFNPGKSNNHFGVDSNSKAHALNSAVAFPSSHTPTSFTGLSLTSLNFDRFNQDGSSPAMLASKEESAPNYIFNTY